MKKYLALLLILVLVVAVSVMAVSAATGDIDFSAGGTVSAGCPHCDEETVNWLPLTNELVKEWSGNYPYVEGSSHYYVAEESVTLGKAIELANGESLCLHLNGNTLTRGNNARAFAVYGDLRIMDHAANEGLVTCMASDSSTGGVVRLYDSSCSFDLYGGILEMRTGTSTTTNCTGNGGVVWVHSASGSVFNMHGGTIRGGLAQAGGNVFVSSNGTFNMYGGAILGGKAIEDTDTTVSIRTKTGGNIYLGSSAKFNMYGGTIEDGESVGSGGNIYLGTSAQFNMYGGTIDGGNSSASGGNIFATSSSKISIADDDDASTPAPVVKDGVSVNYGGNIYASGTLTIGVATISNGEATGRNSNGGGNIYGSDVSLTGATISGGKAQYGGSIWASKCTVNAETDISGGYATDRGGNFYVSSIGSILTITGGTVRDGYGYQGGNIYANNGYITISGGTISGGRGRGGGNIYCNVGNAASTDSTSLKNYVKIDDDGDPTTPVPVITGGIATDSHRAGGNILVLGIAQIGNCIIKDGVAPESGKDIMLDTNGKLKVFSDFAGECSIDFVLNHMPAEANGEYLDATLDSCEGPFAGKLYWDADPDRPYLFGKEGDTKLYMTAAAAMNKNGKYTFYKSNEEMVAACNTNTASIRPVAGELNLTGGDYVVDLYGRAVNITGTGTVTCYDSANSDFKTNGTATVNGPTLTNTTKATVAGGEYYTTVEEGAYAFHLLDMRLTNVTVRPANTGIFYQGVWLCDKTLAAKIDTFGIAVSLMDLPGVDFADDNSTMYTAFNQSEFVIGGERSGVLIEDILDELAPNNTSRSKKPIYAAAYIVFKDGSVAITDDEVAFSLHDVATIIAEDSVTNATKVQPMGELVETWKPFGLNWALNFEVDQDVLQLQSVYEGTTVYHGELHDHSMSGTRPDGSKSADGKLTPDQWKIGLKQKKMDFATLVDHQQIQHMYADFWDPTVFIGGSEAAALLDYLPTDQNKIHMNMIFAEPEGFVKTVSTFKPFNYKDGFFTYPWTGNELSKEQVVELIDLVKDNGGLFVHVHPKSSGYIVSEDPLDYWFADWTGLEVFYGYGGYAPNQSVNTKNYKLWTDLLAAGKRIWATAGCDLHKAPQTTALTTIYATERHATAWLDQAKAGNMVCGPVGIRMSIGDTAMGSQTSFEGKRLVLSVGDFHEVAYYADHTYRFDVITDTGVVYSQEFDQDTTTYYGMDADVNAKFYRVEVFDTTTDTRIAIGNPIWNEAFYE